jgi:serine/threonine protein kinase
MSHAVATNKCDVWSMGTMLYEMINGRRPWNAGNIVDYDK